MSSSPPLSESSPRPLQRITCGECRRVLEFSGEEVPRYCAYCGQLLREVALPSTVAVPAGPLSTGNGHAEASVEVPAQIGGYRLVRRLGTGGMGVVFEAEAPETDRRVAVKLLGAIQDSAPLALERFRQEGRLASMIAHPHCVFVVAADEEAGRPYIVMELMPGTTLRDHVEQHGPMPPAEAVAKALDVIDGLREAHRLGVIHRDVKPSNCFLVPDGRVKIGDFGLSKSLVGDAHLTHTGAFLGTPLFASPEQIKGEAIDFRTDVYSVAATLYYLLTGKAPFQHGSGAAATLARIVSEPPPPIRQLRPEVAPALERVVLRGLERDRDDRWRSLDDFRNALVALVPGNLSFGGLSLRFGAFLIDGLLSISLQVAGRFLLDAPGWLLPWLSLVPLYLYFFWTDGLYEGSLGKQLLRLRVWTNGRTDRPGLSRALVRTAVHFGLIGIPLAIVQLGALTTLSLAPLGIGLIVLAYPMSVANGYRGLHELVSGTRVIQLPVPERPHLLQRWHPDRLIPTGAQPAGVPEQLGPFRTLGVLRWEDNWKILLAEDAVLQRKVCVLMQPASQAGLDPKRRGLTRPTRLRWLTSGQTAERSWHAFVAPAGGPLADYVRPGKPLPWHDVRPVLQQLADELAAACRDDTLPAELTIDQVWIEPSGRAHLLDVPLHAAVPTVLKSPQERSLDVLRQAAVLLLEGHSRHAGAAPAVIRAPVPLHAQQMLARLMGVKQPYARVEEFQADLEATRNLPPRVTPSLVAGYLGVFCALTVPGLVIMVYASQAVKELPESLRHIGIIQGMVEGEARRLGQEHEMLDPVIWMVMYGGAITLWPALWVAWAFVFRGGLTMPAMGLSLVRRSGRKATHLQCAFRIALVWAPVVVLLWTASWVQDHHPDLAWLHWSLRGLGVAAFLVQLAVALLLPGRSLNDWLARTYVVPQ